MLDVGNSAILDCREITLEEMIELVGGKDRYAVSRAVQSRRIPPAFDKKGPGGSARWFVGQLRAWLQADADKAVADMKKAFKDRFPRQPVKLQ